MDNIEKWKEKILAYALKNAVEHEGKSQESSVLAGLFHEGLDKSQVKEIIKDIKAIVGEVNALPLQEQEKEFAKLQTNVGKRKEKEGLPPLENVSGQIVTRIAPEPSKYNHIGHALTFLLNYVYAKRYKGKCILKFEDTNPEKVKKEYVDAMKSDVIDYLGIKITKTVFVSDYMKKLYSYAEKLIKEKKAYMCFCKQEELKKLREQGIECGHRQHDAKENMKIWKEFLKGKYMDGEVSLRIKGEMQNPNYVLRDSVLFRAIKAKHFRHGDKYKVWPMYDFYNPIVDSLLGVTHIFRSNEFAPRIDLQKYIQDSLGLKKTEIIQYGRFNVIDAVTQGRELRELVETGKVMGWDDPRLVTLKALKRRGIVRETYYELTENIGLNQNQVNLDFDMIASINRKIIDPIANRYSFIETPVKLNIDKIPIKEIQVKIHPEKKQIRKLTISKLFISEKDYNEFLGKEIRLMHLFNIKLGKKKTEVTSIENKEIPRIQWVSQYVNSRIMMPDATWKSGIAEIDVKKLKIGDIIQFERFGFVRFDRINDAGEYEFWFAHK